MNISNDIKQLLDNETADVSKQWCDQACEKYPYFTLPAVMYLQQHAADTPDSNLLARVAISYPNRESLYCLLGENGELFAGFYPEEKPQATPSTENTIDTFLNTFGSTSEKEIEVLNNLIFNPVPDYADMLAAEEQQSIPQTGEAQSENDRLINDFITKSKQKEGHFPSTTIHPESPAKDEETQQVQNEPINKPEDVDASMLSESLAKIYIKQHKYSKALEIITNISLKFPEKSIYFADQIRFLKKLMLNEQIKNNK